MLFLITTRLVNAFFQQNVLNMLFFPPEHIISCFGNFQNTSFFCAKSTQCMPYLTCKRLQCTIFSVKVLAESGVQNRSMSHAHLLRTISTISNKCLCTRTETKTYWTVNG